MAQTLKDIKTRQKELRKKSKPGEGRKSKSKNEKLFPKPTLREASRNLKKSEWPHNSLTMPGTQYARGPRHQSENVRA